MNTIYIYLLYISFSKEDRSFEHGW